MWERLAGFAIWEALWDDGSVGWWFRRTLVSVIVVFCVWATYMQWLR